MDNLIPNHPNNPDIDYVQSVVDDQYQDSIDDAYFSRETILDHAKDTAESGEFITQVMTAFFDYMEAPDTELEKLDFAGKVRELCQQLRNDTASYVVENE